MTDDASSTTNRAFDGLASSLYATGEAPDFTPTMTLVEAAYRAALYAYQEAQDASDPRTNLDLHAAQDCFMRIVKQERGEPGEGSYDTEGLAAYSLERSLTALRRSWEIKAGLCQPMTAGQMNRRGFGVDEPTRLGQPDQSRRKAWVAALRARLPWTRPEDTRAPAGLREITDKYNITLDWLKVPEEIQRRVDARRERDRQMMNPPSRATEANAAVATESHAAHAGVTIQ